MIIVHRDEAQESFESREEHKITVIDEKPEDQRQLTSTQLAKTFENDGEVSRKIFFFNLQI